MKQIHVKTRLITFVSTCRRRNVAHNATRGFQDTVIGAGALTKGAIKVLVLYYGIQFQVNFVIFILRKIVS